jgi:hypothetical protein
MRMRRRAEGTEKRLEAYWVATSTGERDSDVRQVCHLKKKKRLKSFLFSSHKKISNCNFPTENIPKPSGKDQW